MKKYFRLLTLSLFVSLGACDAVVEGIGPRPSEWKLSSTTDNLTGNSTQTEVRTIPLDEGVVEITAICQRDIALWRLLPDTEDPTELATAFFNSLLGNLQSGILGDSRSDAVAFTIAVHPHNEQASLPLDTSNTDGQNMLVRASFHEGEAVRIVSSIKHVNSIETAIGVHDIRSANRPIMLEVPLLYHAELSNNTAPLSVSGVLDLAYIDEIFQEFLEGCSPTPALPPTTRPSNSTAAASSAPPQTASSTPQNSMVQSTQGYEEEYEEETAYTPHPDMGHLLSRKWSACIDNSIGDRDMVMCNHDEFTVWHARLNAAWRSLPAATRRDLLNEQRKWIRLKDRQCALDPDGGTLALLYSSSCDLHLTVERTQQLENWGRVRN